MSSRSLRSSSIRRSGSTDGCRGADLAAVDARSLQRNPEDRYPNIAAFINDLDHLDQVDTAILEKGTGPASAAPIWRSPTFVAVGISILIMLAIVLLAFAAQSLRGM